MHENSRERKAKPRLPSKKCTTTKPKWSTTGTFTNQKTEEETKQQGKIGYSGTNAREKNTKPTQQKCHMAENKSNIASQVAEK